MKKYLVTGFLFLLLLPKISIGNKHALVIGISDYKNLPSSLTRDIADLNGPENDARSITEILKTRYDFEVKTLLNSEATRQEIINLFDEWLVQGTKPGDLVVFYYSGHGSQVPDFNGDESDGLDEVLLPYDFQRIGGHNIIIDDEFGVMLRKLVNREVVVIIDACHAGTMTRGIRGGGVSFLEATPASRLKFIPIIDYKPQYSAKSIPIESDEPENQIFMAASRENERSFELSFPNNKYYGIFTHVLTDGLKKKKRNVTYKALFEYIEKTIDEEYNLPQTPKIEPDQGELIAHVVFTTHLVVQESLPQPPPRPSKPEPTQPTPLKPDTITKPQQPKPPAELVKPPKPETTAMPAVPITPDTLVKPTAPVSSEETENQPIPEITTDKVLVAIDEFKGADAEIMKRFQEALSKLSYIKLTKEHQFFDVLVRGEVIGGEYKIRILNKIGDAIKIPTAPDFDKLINVIAQKLEYAYITKQLARLTNPNPTFKVTLKSLYWDEPDKKTQEEYRDFRVNDKIIFKIFTEKPSYIYLFNVDGNGNFNFIFPNKYHTDNRVENEIELPDEKMRRDAFEFQFLPPPGEEMVKVIATTEKLNIESLNIANFKNKFKVFAGDAQKESSNARNMAKDIIMAVTTGKFEWSEASIVIRSHAVK